MPGVRVLQSASGFAGHRTVGMVPELIAGPVLLYLLISWAPAVPQSNPQPQPSKQNSSSICLVHPALL